MVAGKSCRYHLIGLCVLTKQFDTNRLKFSVDFDTSYFFLPNDIKWFRLSNLKVRKVKVLLFSSIVLSVKKERFFSH